MNRYSTFCPALAIVATLAAPALATDRYFLDSTATSPSGRYRIDANSPDNAGGRSRPFASNFTYTLTDTTTKKTVWTRQQPMSRDKGSTYASPQEPSPVDVFVNDDGLVVARTSWDSLIVLDPASGKKRGEHKLLESFPEAEQRDFVHDTTAGPRWSQRSDWFFINLPASGNSPATCLFVVRPYWHHRMVIDCATAKPLDLGVYHSAASVADFAGATAEIKRTLTSIMEQEAARSLATLRLRLSKLGKETDYREYRAVTTAIQTAAFRKLDEAEPDLRAIERELIDAKADRYQLINGVRRALRALGKVPASVPGRYEPQQRIANAPSISESMSANKIKDLLGDPDASVYDNGHGHDYDIDASPPYTLRVISDHLGQTTVRKISPLSFLHDPKRMWDS